MFLARRLPLFHSQMKREKAVVKPSGRTDCPVFTVGYGLLGKPVLLSKNAH